MCLMFIGIHIYFLPERRAPGRQSLEENVRESKNACTYHIVKRICVLRCICIYTHTYTNIHKYTRISTVQVSGVMPSRLRVKRAVAINIVCHLQQSIIYTYTIRRAKIYSILLCYIV